MPNPFREDAEDLPDIDTVTVDLVQALALEVANAAKEKKGKRRKKATLGSRREKKAKVGLQILQEQLGDILNSVALHAQKIVNSRIADRA